MSNQDETKTLISELIAEAPDVACLKSRAAQAYVLHTQYAIDRKDLCEYFSIANSSITRAKQAIEQGFDAGCTGRHQILSCKDEHILERWLEFLIDISQTVYTSTVIELVLIFYNHY